jgi:hypothetical protein
MQNPVAGVTLAMLHSPVAGVTLAVLTPKTAAAVTVVAVAAVAVTVATAAAVVLAVATLVGLAVGVRGDVVVEVGVVAVVQVSAVKTGRWYRVAEVEVSSRLLLARSKLTLRRQKAESLRVLSAALYGLSTAPSRFCSLIGVVQQRRSHRLCATAQQKSVSHDRTLATSFRSWTVAAAIVAAAVAAAREVPAPTSAWA